MVSSFPAVIFCPHATISAFSNLREIFRKNDKLHVSFVLHGLSCVPKTAVAIHVDITATSAQCGSVPVLISLTLGVVEFFCLQILVPSSGKTRN
jgi:hypothetical protein